MAVLWNKFSLLKVMDQDPAGLKIQVVIIVSVCQTDAVCVQPGGLGTV